MVSVVIRRHSYDLLAFDLVDRGMGVRYETHLILEVDQRFVMLCEHLVDLIGK